MTSPIRNWDPYDGTHVDDSVLKGPDGTDYVNGENVVLAAGPPTTTREGWADSVFPIGLVQNASIAQSRQLQQLFELGSRESYMIPGKTFVNLTLSRVLINGPNLLKAMYASTYEGSVAGDGDIGSAPAYLSAEGTGDFWIDMASEVFARPIGLMLYMLDTEKDAYAASYIEKCYIQSHQMSLTAQQTLILENVQIRGTRVRPIFSVSNPDTNRAFAE